ncbi:MAG: hypothetical protein K2X87_04435 [Gemmataceae bacterium]|nr:hypothetical protein [Gemmataceae bacterium]
MRRWLKRTAAGGLLVVAALVAVGFIARAAFRRAGDREVAAVTAALDAEEPGWRIDAIQAARAKAAPPDADNPMAIVLSLHGRLPPVWDDLMKARDGGGAVVNAHPVFSELLWLLQGRAATGDLAATAQDELLRPGVLARPNGYHPVEIADNPWDTLLPHVQNSRAIFALLDADGRLAAVEGDPDRAVRDARAGLVAARGPGDEPFMISQLVRLAGANVAVRTALQALAWGEPAAGLAELQAELLAEADQPGFLVGLRGERAVMDRVFDGLDAGRIDLRNMGGGRGESSTFDDLAFAAYRGFLPGDRAMGLRTLNAVIEAAKLPTHEQRDAVAAVPLPPGPKEDSYRYIVSRLMLPAYEKVHEAHLRTMADLRAAAAAIACERFRQKIGRWPESLDELPKDILPAVPADPYTGRPVLFHRFDDGVGVYVVPPADARPPAFRPPVEFEDPDPLEGRGRGWRVWDPAARGTTRPAPDREFIPEEPAEDGPPPAPEEP